MSAHLERARLLLHQSRPAEAEQEALFALGEEPQDPFAYALLALSRIDQQKAEAAVEAARTALGLAPDVAYLHYVHALVLHRTDQDAAALAAVGEAIRLDPEDADAFTLEASIHLARRDWPAALASAEQGLARQPEHVGAANLRAMALVRLGRKSEAMQTVDQALERAPENAVSHANQGWNYLHRNDPRRAQEFFREALRLDPELEYARQGMLEALKARNPVYRAMLAYALWIGRQRGWIQAGFVIATFFTSSFVNRTLAATAHPSRLFLAGVVLFYGFIYLSWTAAPMFNLLLRLDRFGRLVLAREERIASNWFGVPALVAFGCLAWWAAGGGAAAVFGAIICAMLSICAAATWARRERARHILAICSGVLAVLGLGGLGALAIGQAVGINALTLFFYGFLGFQILANVIRR